jgi:23S rRNA (cytosine1962-C5)-methyltransferase
MQTDYRLLDTGNGKRLEQVGDIIINRTAKQANWRPALSKSEWSKAHTTYDDNWSVDIPEFTSAFDDITFSLATLETGQIGVFPEQMQNWQWLKDINTDKDWRIVNGFAYTGGSTLFASNAQNHITHLDASKPAINRAKINAQLSGKSDNNIRYITEDMITFLEKEVKRGNTYDGFIFDPPAFGRGPKGKKWKLTSDMPKLINLIDQLSDGQPKFILLSAHDSSLTPRKLADMIRPLSKGAEVEYGELIMKTENGPDMQNGYFARFVNETE